MQTLSALAWIVFKILVLVVPLLLSVAYLTFAERKILGYIQNRIGPNRVGMSGLLQPFADLIKIVLKEIIIPNPANRFLFIAAPLLSLTLAFAAWAVVPFSTHVVLADINPGLLYIFAMSSLGVYGVLISGWASNSKYAMFGALRSAAQTVSYEIAMGFSIVGVLLASGTMNISGIVLRQSGGIWHWWAVPLLPLFLVFWIAGIAETNRAPFDLTEGESEIVAGNQVEYSGIAFGLFYVAEYANIILISMLLSLLFLGGWLSPFQGIPVLGALFSWVPGFIWLFTKVAFFLFCYIWVRATFPRYRYDQLMRLGWKVLIPVTIVWIVVVAAMVVLHTPPWF